MRYHDDDFDDPMPQQSLEHATVAGMYGFIFAIASLGLLAVVVVLWVLLVQENQVPGDDRARWMFYWFLFLDAISFIGALIATILGARGVSPSNPLYRGCSVAAVILGVIELVIASIFGLIFFCGTLIFELNRMNIG